MLIDLHATPGATSPKAFAAAAAQAGLEAVVFADTNRVDRYDAYADALEAAGVVPFLGIELPLERGTVVLIPANPDAALLGQDWGAKGRCWTADEISERCVDFDGAIISSHPYCRDLPSFPGDRVYALKGLTAIETRVGRGQGSWDAMADSYAETHSLCRVGTSSGDANWLGRAATVVAGTIESQADLVKALNPNNCMPVELEPLDETRERGRPAPPPPRRDDDRGERGHGRGGRDRDSRGHRGDRR